MSNHNKERIKEQSMKRWFSSLEDSGVICVTRLSDIVKNPKVDFEVGDKVDYLPQEGKGLKNLTIMAIAKGLYFWCFKKCIYLNKDDYYFPVHPDELTHHQVSKTKVKD